MENQNTKDKELKFTWNLTNFTSSVSQKMRSKRITLDGHTWTIDIIPITIENLFMAIVLGPVRDRPSGCEKFTNFKFILINQHNHRDNIIKEIRQNFNSRNEHWSNIYASGDGFIVDGCCIFEVHISIHESEHKKQVDESVGNIHNKLVQSTVNLSTKKMISNSPAETVDFRGLGKVDKDFIPLLEEVCSQYPSLIDSKKRKSQTFTEWAFTALGRVLHFLNTKKVRDMKDDGCNHLQILWEELLTCEFDLSWLKPRVEFALGMKTCVKKVLAVKRLEENVITLEEDVTTLEKNVANLETEANTLRTRMFEAKVNLEITRRELVKAKEGFEECDLDAELGFCKP